MYKITVTLAFFWGIPLRLWRVRRNGFEAIAPRGVMVFASIAPGQPYYKVGFLPAPEAREENPL